jgi:outer membrane protein OmpA-like peptidoglycan-associated protein
MKMARLMTVGICGLLALWTTGCGEDPRDLQIRTLQEDIADLERENDALRSQLAMAKRDRDAAMNRANDLAQENRELRLQLARQPEEQIVPPGWEYGGGVFWIDIGTEFLFREGYADLQPAGRAKLQEVVSAIEENFPDKMILVVGHTDDKWSGIKEHIYKDNLALSLARGATVFRELSKLGIPTQRMVAGGQGEFAPRVPNTSEANKALNRRVQIMAVPLPGGGEGGMMERPTGTPPTAAQPERRPPTGVEK